MSAPSTVAGETRGTGSDWVIDLHDVVKTYRSGMMGLGRKRVQALRGITMQVRRGEIFGLLGPNGAGKSTLVKILMTVIRPTRCRGTLLGFAVGNRRSLSKVGYLPEAHRFPEYLKAWQVLDFYGALAGVPGGRKGGLRYRRTNELLELVGLAKWRDESVRGFSKGMKQRLGIANALINDPELVVLDEPTDGVDPVGRKEIREILIRLKGEGKTVFLNSHLLSELEMVCERVAIMVQGQVASQGTLDELTRDSQRYEIATSAESVEDLRRVLGGLLTESGALIGPDATVKEGIAVEFEPGGRLSVATADARPIQPIIDRLRAGGVIIQAVRPARSSLEDLFMQAVTDPRTGRTLEPGAASDAGENRQGGAR